MATMRNRLFDADEVGHNTSGNTTIHEVLQARYSRRAVLKGGIAAAMSALFAGTASAVLAEGKAVEASKPALSFKPVAKSLADALIVPEGYTATVLLATGDPLNTDTPTYSNVGKDDPASFQFRVGDHHDGMHYFGLNAAGDAPDYANAKRGLLCVNHEVAEELFVHPNGPSRPAGAEGKGLADDMFDRPTEEIDKEVRLHGVSIAEVQNQDGKFSVNRASRFNRRITAETPMELTGPARGHPLLVTAYSLDGTRTRGTLNNCGNGYTPWGTYLSCEENWALYFHRREEDSARTPKEVAALKRYGVKGDTSGRYNWARPGAKDESDLYRRWNANALAASAAEDFRHAPNTFGWVVEIDPFDPESVPKKRTALGRFAHEACFHAKPVAGKPLVFYMGDDARGEYIYKFVSDAVWDAADANNRQAGDKYLDKGKLYAAKFHADGTGEWLLLDMSNSAVAQYDKDGFKFSDLGDVLIHARLAADAAGATKMDRPEWLDIHPVTGEIYATLTSSQDKWETDKPNKAVRGTADGLPLDAANPRYYTDTYGGSKTLHGNVHGHIIRWREADNDHAATRFQWDIYLFGAPASALPEVNLSGLNHDNDFSGPDGLWFSRATPGLMWVETDDAQYTYATNCMLLAALPGQVGDGEVVQVMNRAVPANQGKDQVVPTRCGQAATTATLRRFLVGPVDCEVTGMAETPDGKALFINIQHPGENTKPDNLAKGHFTSHWPDGGNARPRSATVVITRNDGGKIAV